MDIAELERLDTQVEDLKRRKQLELQKRLKENDDADLNADFREPEENSVEQRRREVNERKKRRDERLRGMKATKNSRKQRMSLVSE